MHEVLSESIGLNSLKLKYIFIGLLLSYGKLCIVGQNRFLDSLNQVIEKTKGDSAKCMIISTTAIGLQENDPQLAIQVAKRLLNLAQKMQHKRFESSALSIMAVSYSNMSDYEKSLDYHFQCLKIRKEINFKRGIGGTLCNIGNVYKHMSQYPLALEYYFEALKVLESINDKQFISNVLGNIGNLYHDIQEYDKAIEFGKRSLKLCFEIKDSASIASSYNSLANLFLQKKMNDSAIAYYKKGLTIAELTNNDYNKIFICGNIGSFYIQLNDYKNALAYLEKTKQISAKIHYELNYEVANINIATILFSQKKYDEAVKILNQSIAKLKSIGNLEYEMTAYKILFVKAKEHKDFKNALYSFEQYRILSDSIYKTENKNQITRKELKYEYEKKAAADSIKAIEEKKITSLQLQQEENQRYFLYLGLSLTIVFGIFMFNRFKITQKQKHVIENQKLIVEQQKHLVDEKQKEVLDSIRYAKRIQQSLLPTEKYIERIIKTKS